MQTAAPTSAGSSAGMQLILVTGMSGSGKSVALKVLEDSG
jgi:Tfp pilus assembly pilus retraction ATPase PilT